MVGNHQAPGRQRRSRCNGVTRLLPGSSSLQYENARQLKVAAQTRQHSCEEPTITLGSPMEAHISWPVSCAMCWPCCVQHGANVLDSIQPSWSQDCAPAQQSETGAFEEDKLPKHTQAEHDGRELCQHDTARTLRGTRHGSPRHIGTGSLRAESSPSYSPHLRGSVSRLATLSVLSCHRSSPATHCVWCTLCAPQRANTHPVQHMRRSKSVHGAQDIAAVRG